MHGLLTSAVFQSDGRNSGNIRQICFTMGRGQVYAEEAGCTSQMSVCSGMAVGQHELAVRLAAAVGRWDRCTRGL